MKRFVLVVVMLGWVVSASAQSLTLEWTAPTGYTPDGYVAYRGGSKVSGDALITALTWTDSTVQAGQRYCYTVRARKGEAESADSNEACGTVPIGAPTIVKCTITFPVSGGTATMACQGS